LIDLHTHTSESDGTASPRELVALAIAAGLDALAITDHDTFSGYDAAVAPASELGLRLLCGIEISTAWGQPKQRTVHLLGYWFDTPPTAQFRAWLDGIQTARRDRNRRLALRLQELGLDVRLEDAEAIGRNMTGRPHFARVMVEKGFVSGIREAFDRYLDESAIAYVERDEPSFEEAVRRVGEAGGLASLAHPVRLGNKTAEEEERIIERMVSLGLPAIEAWHSDHSATDSLRYLRLAQRHGLLVTGGSDYHGEHKPGVVLGRGAGNLNIPLSILEALMQPQKPARR
jgi:predicted metal-dependent phosphoesterase TrpH